METPAVRYLTASDGVKIAYVSVGDGEPFVFIPGPLTLEISWGFPRPVRALLDGLVTRFRVIQYDHRGSGLSSRKLSNWTNADLVRDIETLAEGLSLRPFVLFAAVGFGHIALRYALAHPARLRALIIHASPVSGRTWNVAMHDQLPKEDWELFLRNSMPSGLSQEETKRYFELLVRGLDRETAVKGQRAALESDLTDVLANVRVPTLVTHSRDFLQLRPEESMRLAAAIPNARMVLIDGTEMWGDHEQALKAIDDFIASLPVTPPTSVNQKAVGVLSDRELDVLRLIAAGKTNPKIAEALFISRNTVQNHVASILTKAGLANRAEAAAYAERHGLT
jgi:pimeloyl-ACP methyl ester carboxylesterase/DNA-binding CsgD family transcriptional regulator